MKSGEFFIEGGARSPKRGGCAEIEGDYTEEIAEFTKYVPHLKNDRY